MNLKKINTQKKISLFFVVFYIVGLFLYSYKPTLSLFISITPISLLLNIVIVFLFHKKWDVKTISIFSFVTICSFIIEMLGVSTGRIFGNYVYDEGLGFKLFETPIIIGLNWLFLVYASQSIISMFFNNNWLRIILSACLMVAYDLLMEWVAPSMHMWHFTTAFPPVINFTSWFLIALLFQTLFVASKINVKNTTAKMLFIIQMLFFLSIGIIKQL